MTGHDSMRRLRNATAGLLLAVAPSLAAGAFAQSSESSVPRFRIELVAGRGSAGFSGDGGPAIKAELNKPTAVAVGPDGSVYVADFGNHRVRRVAPDGTIETVMGTGKFSLPKSELPAIETNLAMPYGLNTGPEGQVWVLSRSHHRLLRSGHDGVARRVTGTGRRGFSGDGGKALTAQLDSPNHLVVAQDRTIFIADSRNHRIRRIDSQGNIETVAGTGEEGFGGDGGPAEDARLAFPSALALDGRGRLYIADFGNHRIRRLRSDGTIETLVGTGETDFNGDGRTGVSSNIGEPTGVAVDPGGNVFVADQINNRIRVLTSDGLLHTCAGTGEHGDAGDGGDAREALISTPDILAADSEGNLYFPDYGNHKVRKLVRLPD